MDRVNWRHRRSPASGPISNGHPPRVLLRALGGPRLHHSCLHREGRIVGIVDSITSSLRIAMAQLFYPHPRDSTVSDEGLRS